MWYTYRIIGVFWAGPIILIGIYKYRWMAILKCKIADFCSNGLDNYRVTRIPIEGAI